MSLFRPLFLVSFFHTPKYRRLMKNALELKPEDLPVTIRLKSPEGTKVYVLLKTKQDRLLLNRPQETSKQYQL